ncbi:TPA: von Willebrand factor binding protein Vwb [Staphylococcus aureus]
MKKKVLILTLGALCASQLWNSDNASAIVTGEKNPYISEALSIEGKRSANWNINDYKNDLSRLLASLQVSRYDGFDEPEYKDIYSKYQQKVFAEIDAVNKFIDEEKKISSYNNRNLEIPTGIFGMTHERYLKIYDSLKENKKEFELEEKKITNHNDDLKRFNEEEIYEARLSLNTIENQVLMLGYAFGDKKEVREDLYNKLDLIMGVSDSEREQQTPKNKRMFDEKVEDLESIIDEFFEEIGENRPENIPALTYDDSKTETENKIKNRELAEILKADTKAAKTDISKRSKRSLDKQNHSSLSEEVSEEQKVEYNKEMKEIKEKFLAKSKVSKPVVSLIDDEDDNGKDRQLIISTPTNKPVVPPTYTETTTQVPMPVVERQTQQQIIYNAPKQLAGLNGESHDFTTTHQSPTTSNHTHNNVVEFEETSALPGRKSGSLVGFSQTDSSHLTEREKRVIKREHVREAQKLVDNYKDTHSYNDRVKAQQKVNTLSEGHQKRFNKQINKVYSGQ